MRTYKYKKTSNKVLKNEKEESVELMKDELSRLYSVKIDFSDKPEHQIPSKYEYEFNLDEFFG